MDDCDNGDPYSTYTIKNIYLTLTCLKLLF